MPPLRALPVFAKPEPVNILWRFGAPCARVFWVFMWGIDSFKKYPYYAPCFTELLQILMFFNNVSDSVILLVTVWVEKFQSPPVDHANSPLCFNWCYDLAFLRAYFWAFLRFGSDRLPFLRILGGLYFRICGGRSAHGGGNGSTY